MLMLLRLPRTNESVGVRRIGLVELVAVPGVARGVALVALVPQPLRDDVAPVLPQPAPLSAVLRVRLLPRVQLRPASAQNHLE